MQSQKCRDILPGLLSNVLDEDENSRRAAESHLKKVIDASRKLEIGMVTTFIGRNHNKTIEENLEIMKKIWTPLLRYAEEREIRIAIENCPMLFGKEQWPGGQNLFGAPAIWREVFEILPSSCLGINYDPSHFIWQMMDYIQPIYELRIKIFMYISRILRFIGTGWMTWEPWLTP